MQQGSRAPARQGDRSPGQLDSRTSGQQGDRQQTEFEVIRGRQAGRAGGMMAGAGGSLGRGHGMVVCLRQRLPRKGA